MGIPAIHLPRESPDLGFLLVQIQCGWPQKETLSKDGQAGEDPAVIGSSDVLWDSIFEYTP